MSNKCYEETTEHARVLASFSIARPDTWNHLFFIDIPHANCLNPASWISHTGIDIRYHDLGIYGLAHDLFSEAFLSFYATPIAPTSMGIGKFTITSKLCVEEG